MAAILERDALEEARLLEEQRLAAQEQQRLLEEAQLVAQQQAQTPAGIPQMPALMPQAVETPMASPVVPPLVPGLEERISTGDVPVDSEQYQNELARAQRGNGFLAPEVGVAGGLISGGYDPSTDPREIVARREADNLQRNQYISGLVRGGATYAEALRAGLGRYPNTVNPRLALQAEALALRSQPFTPRMVNVGGKTMIENRRNSFIEPRAEKPQKFVGGKASEATKIAADNIADQITALRRRLEPGSTGMLLIAPEEVAAIKAEIAQKEKQRVDLFNTPEANNQVDQPSWLRMRDAFNRQPPIAPATSTATAAAEVVTPFKEGATVRNKQNGKLYKIVKGQPVEVAE